MLQFHPLPDNLRLIFQSRNQISQAISHPMDGTKFHEKEEKDGDQQHVATVAVHDDSEEQ